MTEECLKTPLLKVADAHDIKAFLRLQEVNLITNIPAKQHTSGFVTTPFTVDHLHHLIAEKELFLALDETGQVAAYLACPSWGFLQQWPIFYHMVSLFSGLTYREEPVSAHNSYQYGPVCIDARYRGTPLLSQLFQYGRQQMASRHPFAFTFVNKRNQRSYEAHSRKLGLETIGEFSFNDNEYHIMGFATAEHP